MSGQGLLWSGSSRSGEALSRGELALPCFVLELGKAPDWGATKIAVLRDSVSADLRVTNRS